jgi:hypothetical protein
VSPALFLAFAGLPDEMLDQLNEVGWFLPFLALILPVSLILLLALGKPVYIFLFALQGGALYYGSRAFGRHLRRSHFTSMQVKMALGPIYLLGCFVTNLFVILGYDLIHRLIAPDG